MSRGPAWRGRLARLVGRLGLAALAGALWAAPIAVFVLYAFSRRWFYPALWPAEWTAAPFLGQLRDPRLRSALGQSAAIALLVSGLSLLVAYPAARALELRVRRGKRLIYGLLFLPTIVPAVATGMGLNIFLLRLGLDGTLWGVALVHLVPVLPYAVLTLGGVFARYDPAYEQQARALGANDWYVFTRVTVRLLRPGLVVTALLAFVISWSQYALTLLVGGGRVITLPILLFSTVVGGNPASISVQSLLFVAPLVAIIAACARYLAGGAGAGRNPRAPGELPLH